MWKESIIYLFKIRIKKQIVVIIEACHIFQLWAKFFQHPVAKVKTIYRGNY